MTKTNFLTDNDRVILEILHSVYKGATKEQQAAISRHREHLIVLRRANEDYIACHRILGRVGIKSSDQVSEKLMTLIGDDKEVFLPPTERLVNMINARLNLPKKSVRKALIRYRMMKREVLPINQGFIAHTANMIKSARKVVVVDKPSYSAKRSYRGKRRSNEHTG